MGCSDCFARIIVSAIIVIAGFQVGAGRSLIVHAQADPTRARAVQSLGTEGLTLQQAADIALRTNPLIRATDAGREMADAQLSEARAARLPILQFNLTFANSNNPVFVFGSLLEQARFGLHNFDPLFLNSPPSLNNFRTTMTLRLPLFDQMQAGARIAQARIGQEQADMQRQLIEQQILFEVVRSYYGVILAQARKEVSDEAVKMAEADVKRIRDLFETGLVVASDLMAAEVHLAEFRQQQIQAAGDVVAAYAALNTALGLPVNTQMRVIGELSERIFEVADQEELIRMAMLHRPDYARSDAAVRSTKQGLRAALGQYLPRLDVFATFGTSGQGLASGSADYILGASLAFNIFDLGRSAKLKQARAAESLATAERERLADQISLEVVRAYQQYASARERLVVAARAVNQAIEAMRIVQDRYREGLTTITEVLRAETALVRSRMNLLAARYDYYVGYAGVLLATGRLTDVQPFVS